ncbi:hypothetical protein [Acidipropionibacterium acidipropionici]|uniref:hypothetical protein n=1 Tax=Acidipropionibacterium acidipropionici TaxID=1748 RepID=UPI00110BDC78|nr:hypothetical protein [Acidipropionibacterium acidipropionici]QCV93928.1 hypothetical protein FEZ30_00350 [Acidipropionibacterium acidipropionici]
MMRPLRRGRVLAAATAAAMAGTALVTTPAASAAPQTQNDTPVVGAEALSFGPASPGPWT